MSDAELSESAQSAADSLALAQIEIERLTETCAALVAAQRAIVEVQDQRRTATVGPVDWAWLLEVPEPDSTARYKQFGQTLSLLARSAGHNGLTSSGYNPETMQRVVRVSLLKHRPELTLRVLAGLEQLLPFIKMRAPDVGQAPYKYLGVFESTLSEGGSYRLAINEELSMYELRVTRYGRERCVQACTSLSELLAFVQLNCWYSDEA